MILIVLPFRKLNDITGRKTDKSHITQNEKKSQSSTRIRKNQWEKCYVMNYNELHQLHGMAYAMSNKSNK